MHLEPSIRKSANSQFPQAWARTWPVTLSNWVVKNQIYTCKQGGQTEAEICGSTNCEVLRDSQALGKLIVRYIFGQRHDWQTPNLQVWIRRQWLAPSLVLVHVTCPLFTGHWSLALWKGHGGWTAVHAAPFLVLQDYWPHVTGSSSV